MLVVRTYGNPPVSLKPETGALTPFAFLSCVMFTPFKRLEDQQSDRSERPLPTDDVTLSDLQSTFTMNTQISTVMPMQSESS